MAPGGLSGLGRRPSKPVRGKLSGGSIPLKSLFFKRCPFSSFSPKRVIFTKTTFLPQCLGLSFEEKGSKWAHQGGGPPFPGKSDLFFHHGVWGLGSSDLRKKGVEEWGWEDSVKGR